MGQGMAALQLEQPLKVVRLVALNLQALHQVQDQLVIKAPDLVAGVPLRPEVAGHAEFRRVGQRQAGRFVHHLLGDGDMGVQALLAAAFKVDKAAHGVEQSPHNGDAQPQPPCKAAAAGIRLVKIVVHLCQLGFGHANAGIVYVDDKVDAVAFPAVLDADVDAALLGEFDRVFQQGLQHMGDLLRVADEHRRYFGVKVEDQLQLVFAALHRRCCQHIVDHRGNPVLLPRRGQGALRNLGVIQDVADLVGEALARQLDGLDILPQLRGEVLFQHDLADADDHIDGGAELVGHVGEELHILTARRFQLLQNPVLPPLPRHPAVDPVSCNLGGAGHQNNAQHQAYRLLKPHPGAGGIQQQEVVKDLQDVQSGCYVQQPLSVQHGKDKNQNAGHGRDIKKTGAVYPEEKELHQYQAGAEVLVQPFRIGPADVEVPHPHTAGGDQRDHPGLPGHQHDNQYQYGTEHGSHNSQQQVLACLFFRLHCLPSSFATRFSSSWGKNGFFR